MSEVADTTARAFVAIELPEAVTRGLWRAGAPYRDLPVRVSWTPPERIHLTLVFLGEIDKTRVDEAGRILDGVCAEVGVFEFGVAGLGTFGTARRPSVVWAGIPEPPEALMGLQARLKQEFTDAGFFLSGKGFSPHITLGRVRSMKKVAQLTSAIASANNIEFGIVPVRRVLLVQSHLGPGGVRYENLRESGLKGS